MAHQSAPSFRTLHALRIKGFAKAETLAELADLDVAEVDITSLTCRPATWRSSVRRARSGS